MDEPPRLKRSERLSRSALPPAAPGIVGRALLRLVSRIPKSAEPANDHPTRRAQAIARAAARKAAAISGTLSLPPGPLGLSTVLPDLYAIWRVQQKMVADIAGAYGQEAFLGKETMIYCLFKHGGAVLLRDLVVRTGERVVVRRAAVNVMRQVLEKAGMKVTQSVMEKSVSRWLPIIGAVGMGAYAYHDTMQVGKSAIDLFTSPLELEPPTDEPPFLSPPSR